MPAGISLVEDTGTIVSSNAAWPLVPQRAGTQSKGAAVPSERPSVWDVPLGPNGSAAGAVVEGIRDVLSRRQEEFIAEYPWRSTDEKRWFSVRAKRLENENGGCVLVLHEAITARKRVEEALSESETRHRLVARATNDAVWDWDMTTQKLEWNEGVERLFGYSAEEISPDFAWWSDRIHPEDRDRVVEGVHSAIDAGRQIWSDEYRYRCRDGSYALVIDRGYVVHDETGAPVRMIGAMLDVTERRLAKELRRRHREILTLYRLSEIALRALEPGAVYAELVEEIGASTGFPIVLLELHDEARRKMVLRAARGVSLPADSGEITSPVSETISGAVAASGQPVFETNLEARLGRSDEILRRTGARLLVCVPMTAEQRVIGTLSLAHTGDIAVDDSLVPWAIALGRHVASLIRRLQSEEALKESEERFRQLAENIQEVFWMSDPDKTRMIYVSPAYEKVWGVPRETLYERPRSFADAILPEDRERVLADLPKQALGTFNVEYRLRRPDGAVRWLWARAFPVRNERGEVYRIAGITEDVTDRKRADDALRSSEERTRRIIDAALDAVVTVSPSGAITGWNRQATLTYGWQEDEVLGRSLAHMLLAPRDRERFERILVSLERSEDPPVPNRPVEMAAIHRDGSEFPVEVAVSPFQVGETISFGAFIRDVTQRRRAEEQARRHQAELAHASRLATTGEMASVIAHEINQPLSAIANYAQGCVRRIRAGSGSPADLLVAMEEVAAQAERAGEIIRRVRSFVRKEEPRWTAADINEIVRDVADLAAAEATQWSVTMRLDLSVDLPRVHADVIQIEQVLLNLVRNALEAMSELDPARREVVIRTAMASAEVVEVHVHDTGRGVAEEDRERIFDSFFTTKPKGMGLGLSISRSIVSAHGGRLWSVPNEGPGMSFRFTLPTVRVACSDEA